MVRGSCLCGGIQFEADSVPVISLCHCSMCRKSHGAAFVAHANIRTPDFRLVKGEELIQNYESSPGIQRAFCRVCGSNAPYPWFGGTWSVPAGLFDDDPGVRPAIHIFVGSKAPWWQIADDLPQFEEWVPGYGPDDPQ